MRCQPSQQLPGFLAGLVKQMSRAAALEALNTSRCTTVHTQRKKQAAPAHTCESQAGKRAAAICVMLPVRPASLLPLTALFLDTPSELGLRLSRVSLGADLRVSRLAPIKDITGAQQALNFNKHDMPRNERGSIRHERGACIETNNHSTQNSQCVMLPACPCTASPDAGRPAEKRARSSTKQTVCRGSTLEHHQRQHQICCRSSSNMSSQHQSIRTCRRSKRTAPQRATDRTSSCFR